LLDLQRSPAIDFEHSRFPIAVKSDLPDGQPDIADVVYLEQLTGAQYLERRSDVDHYLDVINRLSAASLSPADTIAFFAEITRQSAPPPSGP